MITCTSCVSRNSMSFTYVTGSRCGGAKLIHSGRNMKIILLCPTDFTTAKWMANERVGGWSQNGQHGWFDHSWGIYHKDYTAPEQMGSVPFVGAKLTGSVSWRRHTVVVVCNYNQKDFNSGSGCVTKLWSRYWLCWLSRRVC